jgi:hypothetical protein
MPPNSKFIPYLGTEDSFKRASLVLSLYHLKTSVATLNYQEKKSILLSIPYGLGVVSTKGPL